MTRFKFRAWDSCKESMLTDLDQFTIEQDNSNGVYSGSYNDSGDWSEFIIMQSTGLHDVEGLEIFEGDLLEEHEGHLFEVVWDAKWAKFKLQWRNKSMQFPDWNRGKKMTIVGNIYETPLVVSSP